MAASGFLSKLGATLKSIVKVSITPKGRMEASAVAGPLIILGNGPSLRKNIEEDMDLLRHTDCLAVNFAANSPEFRQIKPKYYLLADPHFFEKASTDPNVGQLIENLNAIDFPLTVFIPSTAKRHRALFNNTRLNVQTFPFTAIEGFEWFENMMMDSRRGMPRPRNVLIPSIMVGIWLGYKEIYLLGADHSWLQTLSVNERNEVVSIQPHYYKEDAKEEERVRATYINLPLHQVLESMTIAFRSYHRIRRYSLRLGVNILNATPGSMIDAFPRVSIHNSQFPIHQLG